MTNEILIEALDTYAEAVRRAVQANINAGLCQTRRDWQEAHEAEADEDDAREALEKAIAAHTSGEVVLAERRITGRALAAITELGGSGF
jgi:hypothetical protein